MAKLETKNDIMFRIEEEVVPSLSTFFPKKSQLNEIDTQCIKNPEIIGSKINQSLSETTFIPFQ